MPAVARKGDREATHCSGPKRAGSFRSVFANGIPMSGVGHKNTPHLLPCSCPVCCCVHTAPLMGGSPNVIAEGRTCTQVIQGSPNVFANGAGPSSIGNRGGTSLALERAKAGIIDATQTEGSS